MRILVNPHNMEIGGSQLNAIEFAEALASRGHDVTVYAPPGRLNTRVSSSGLRLLRSEGSSDATSPVSSARLYRVVKDLRIDLIHAYEWNTIIDAMVGPGWALGTPVLGTVMSMDVPHIIPTDVPLTVGTRELFRQESRHRPDVHLLEPPIDTALNSSEVTADSEATRQNWRVGTDETLIVVVSRLSAHLKLEGILTAIRVVGHRAATSHEHLVIVGEGESAAEVARAADDVNLRVGREVVTLAGAMDDPRPAYAAADIVLGMGGSALKALAFGKPLVVQGEGGYWEMLDERTVNGFLWHGWFGRGDGDAGDARLDLILSELERPGRRRELGRLGRDIIERHYRLDLLTDSLEEICEQVAARHTPLGPRVVNAAVSARIRTWHAVHRRAPRALLERVSR